MYIMSNIFIMSICILIKILCHCLDNTQKNNLTYFLKDFVTSKGQEISDWNETDETRATPQLTIFDSDYIFRQLYQII